MTDKKVLLVDADERTRSWVAIRLEAMDLQVSEALSAAEALDFLESQEANLVITDSMLEGGPKVSEFFNKLTREQKPFILFAESSREEAAIFVPRKDRDQLLAQVGGFFRSKGGPSSKGREFLIIEDSPTLRGIVRRALEKGFPKDVIREAEEGRQALSEMSQKKVDLIITDLEMPGMDGRTFLNSLKSNPILSKKPVLVFSSKIQPEMEEEFKQLPRVRLLAKPATAERIIEEVSILLSVPKPA